MPTLSREQAQARARALLDTLHIATPMVFNEGMTIERPFGWVFFAVTQRWLTTRHPADMYPGIGPIAVDRETGAAEFLATSGMPAQVIAAYEQRWRERTGRR